MKSLLWFVAVALFFWNGPPLGAEDKGALSDNIRIKSGVLGYDLQYRVFVPEGAKQETPRPTLYVTDGQWYIASGQLHTLASKMDDRGDIVAPVVVFLDSTNPDNARENRRNDQFFCRAEYADFFRSELVPTIEQHYPVVADRRGRTILGVSFGGLNAACFGLLAPDVFSGVAMQSPATHPIPKLFDVYAEQPTQPVKIFFSLGTKNDNTPQGRRFKKVLEKKGYDLTYKEVSYGHSWRNWKPLLDDMLLTFYQP